MGNNFNLFCQHQEPTSYIRTSERVADKNSWSVLQG